MLRHHKLKNSNRLWRLVHTVTVVFVFSYIAFDVLDLDLSDFPLKQVARERVVVVTESPKGTELANLLDHDGLRMKPSLLDPSIFKESIRLQHKDKLIALRFRADRIHVLRLGLPRSSTLDSSPAA
jgi:hypothetical protein